MTVVLFIFGYIFFFAAWFFWSGHANAVRKAALEGRTAEWYELDFVGMKRRPNSWFGGWFDVDGFDGGGGDGGGGGGGD
ncbi:MAG TPA: hypothetical protein PKA74_12390 [Bauldia sp.]|nr:hypothetical protein [Bauldia sp.]